MEYLMKGLIKINIISQYEQKYISYSEFIQEFPDSISESQECLYGTKCVEYYVKLTQGKIDFIHYIQNYGGDRCEVTERCCFEYTNTEDKRHPFGKTAF